MKFFKKKKYDYLDPLNYSEKGMPLGRQALIFVWEIFKVVVISLVIIVPVRYFIIKPFYVEGASMEPNFHNHEYLIINEISYQFFEPERGDTVVFRYPFDPKQYFIKRVIGLPGEKIKVSNGEVYIFNQNYPQGEVLEENYLFPAMKTLGEVEVALGDNEYYILGDNRIASMDSRNFGSIKKRDIIGKTLLRGWPLERIGFVVNELEYNL